MAQTATPARFNRATIARIVSELENLVALTDESLCYEESRDYPNEERLDKYNSRIDALQSAIDALGDVE